MNSTSNSERYRLSNAVGRWSGIGPYYAMFPISFAFDVVKDYCPEKGIVFDPFAGRGTSLYVAATSQRRAIGIEINKAAWVYSQAKLHPSPLEDVLNLNRSLGQIAQETEINPDLPDFFSRCYTERVLRYLLAARDFLKWDKQNAHTTLAALILVYLHGAKEKALSNQMRQSKAMAPDYSIRWWADRSFDPPDIDPVTFMEQRIRWRYAKGVPTLTPSKVLLGNSLDLLEDGQLQDDEGQVDLLFTSPPYYNLTSYYYDQWLRLWLLGDSPKPSKTGGEFQNGFWSREAYRQLLHGVFSKSKRLLKPSAVIYIRTDARTFTLETTKSVLRELFPSASVEEKPMPLHKKSQTALYGDKQEKPGEVDLILKLNG